MVSVSQVKIHATVPLIADLSKLPKPTVAMALTTIVMVTVMEMIQTALVN